MFKTIIEKARNNEFSNIHSLDGLTENEIRDVYRRLNNKETFFEYMYYSQHAHSSLKQDTEFIYFNTVPAVFIEKPELQNPVQTSLKNQIKNALKLDYNTFLTGNKVHPPIDVFSMLYTFNFSEIKLKDFSINSIPGPINEPTNVTLQKVQPYEVAVYLKVHDCPALEKLAKLDNSVSYIK